LPKHAGVCAAMRPFRILFQIHIEKKCLNCLLKISYSNKEVCPAGQTSLFLETKVHVIYELFHNQLKALGYKDNK